MPSHRSPRPATRASRLRRLVVPAAAATAVTVGVVAVAVATGGADTPARSAGAVVEAASAAAPVSAPTATGSAAGSESSTAVEDRKTRISRSAPRVVLEAKPKVRDHDYLTAPLNLWPAPHESGKPLAVLEEGGQVAVTGRKSGAFAQILRAGQVRWVHKAYLSDERPVAASTPAAGSGTGTGSGGISSAPCPDGSGTEAGLTSSAVRLFRSVCAAFPALTTYGGWDAHGEHSSGKAIDFMVTDASLGQAVADWARAHAGELDLYDVIWQQHIWTPVRASEGWRAMPDRGSPTANHFDHVHISVN